MNPEFCRVFPENRNFLYNKKTPVDECFKNYVQVFLDDDKYLGSFEVYKMTDSVSNYYWNLSEILKNNDCDGNVFSIRYLDERTNRTKVLMGDDFDTKQIKEVLSEDSEYPKITLTVT